jgi:hypothetical protein
MDKHRAELPGKICDAVLKKILPQMSQLHNDQVAMNNTMIKSMEAVDVVNTRLKSFDDVIAEERESAIRVQQQQAGVLRHIKMTQETCQQLQAKIKGVEDQVLNVRDDQKQGTRHMKQLQRANVDSVKDQEMQERVAAARWNEMKQEAEALQMKLGDELVKVAKQVDVAQRKAAVDLAQANSVSTMGGGGGVLDMTGTAAQQLQSLALKVAAMQGPLLNELQNYKEENRAVMEELARHQQLYRTTQSDFQEVLEEVRMVSTAALRSVGMDIVTESTVGQGGIVTGDGGLAGESNSSTVGATNYPSLAPGVQTPNERPSTTAGSCRPETSPDRRGRRPDSQPNRQGFFLPQPRQPITAQARNKQQRVQRGRFFLKTAPANAPSSGPGYRQPTEGGISGNNNNNRILVSRGGSAGSAGGARRRPRTEPGTKRGSRNFEAAYEHFPPPSSAGVVASEKQGTGGGGTGGGRTGSRSGGGPSLAAAGGRGKDMLALPDTAVRGNESADWWREEGGSTVRVTATVGDAVGDKSAQEKAKLRPTGGATKTMLPPTSAR